jgi:phosphoenolpyruvate carboxykinase (ATP)
MEIAYTRALLNAALRGDLEKVEMRPDPVFGFQVPSEAPGVPKEILNARNTWPNPAEYDAQSKKLAVLFHENFEQFKDQTPKKVFEAGPKV